MSALDPNDHPRPLATSRRWLFGLAGLLALLTVGVMATATIGSTIQTGVRAYVGGEGLWSKAEKNAVIHLERYGVTRDPADWATYRSELERILGDRRARLELEKERPDDAVVREGFIAGGNAAEDVPSMAMLFRTFRHLSYIDQAIAIWTDADAEIDRLDAIAERIKGAVERANASGSRDVTGLALLGAEVDAANTRLSDLEDGFSSTLGEGARWVQSVLLVVMAGILILLVTITVILGRFMLGRLRTADLFVAESIRASEARFEQATRLEGIGRLAGGVAHDFNNLLTAISGYADLLTDGLPEGEQRHDAQEIQRAARRAADLTNQLLAFSQRQVLKPELVSLNVVIEDMRSMLARMLGEDVRLAVDLDPSLPAIVADPGQLERVILNLAVNARDAMPAGGTFTISTERTVVPVATLAHPPEDHLGDGPVEAIAVRIRDTGTGMDESTRARIFEPFFTTKNRGKGTGLGLSTVYGIVDQSGGSIEVESAPGAGSTFTIVLAAAHGEAAEAAIDHLEQPAQPADTRNEAVAVAASEPAPVSIAILPAVAPDPAIDDRPSILVAEDEDTVRSLVIHVLEGAGFRVVAAVDGREALELASGHAPFDALVTDVIMPNVNGPSLARALLERQPDLPVLFLSGYTGDELGERGVTEAGVNLMTKPFRPIELVERVRALLAEAGAGDPAGEDRAADVASSPRTLRERVTATGACRAAARCSSGRGRCTARPSDPSRDPPRTDRDRPQSW